MIPRIEWRSGADPKKGAHPAPTTPMSVIPSATVPNEAPNSAATGFTKRPSTYTVNPDANAWPIKLTPTMRQP